MELVNLLNSKAWPHAVDPALICDISSEQDKEDRAEGILDLIIDIHLENLKFLDFGCGADGGGGVTGGKGGITTGGGFIKWPTTAVKLAKFAVMSVRVFSIFSNFASNSIF